jgi:hypothetical protein
MSFIFHDGSGTQVRVLAFRRGTPRRTTEREIDDAITDIVQERSVQKLDLYLQQGSAPPCKAPPHLLIACIACG